MSLGISLLSAHEMACSYEEMVASIGFRNRECLALMQYESGFGHWPLFSVTFHV